MFGPGGKSKEPTETRLFHSSPRRSPPRSRSFARPFERDVGRPRGETSRTPCADRAVPRRPSERPLTGVRQPPHPIRRRFFTGRRTPRGWRTEPSPARLRQAERRGDALFRCPVASVRAEGGSGFRFRVRGVTVVRFFKRRTCSGRSASADRSSAFLRRVLIALLRHAPGPDGAGKTLTKRNSFCRGRRVTSCFRTIFVARAGRASSNGTGAVGIDPVVGRG